MSDVPVAGDAAVIIGPPIWLSEAARPPDARVAGGTDVEPCSPLPAEFGAAIGCRRRGPRLVPGRPARAADCFTECIRAFTTPRQRS
jgi:hypothetical protein